MKVTVKVSQSCPSLCDPMDYTVRGILQARTLEWLHWSETFPFSRRSSQPREQTQVSRIAGGFLTSWATREVQEYRSGWPIPPPADLPDPGIKPGSPALQVDSLPSYEGSPVAYITLHCSLKIFIRKTNIDGTMEWMFVSPQNSHVEVLLSSVMVFGYGGETESCPVVSDSLGPHGLYSPWNSPGQNTGVGSLSLLQGIFPTQGLNPGVPHCR